MSLSLRAVQAADVPSVAALVRDVLGEFGIAFGVGSDTDDQVLALPGGYTAPGGAFFVAEEGGRLAGTAGVMPMGGGVFELRKMYLRPGERGRGAGRALLEACVAFARSRGAVRLVLDTTEQMAAAIRFYERNGFTRDDACRRAPRCSRGYRLELA